MVEHQVIFSERRRQDQSKDTKISLFFARTFFISVSIVHGHSASQFRKTRFFVLKNMLNWPAFRLPGVRKSEKKSEICSRGRSCKKIRSLLEYLVLACSSPRCFLSSIDVDLPGKRLKTTAGGTTPECSRAMSFRPKFVLLLRLELQVHWFVNAHTSQLSSVQKKKIK
jgi:hypothetical protein